MLITFDQIKYAIYKSLVESKLDGKALTLLPTYNKFIKDGILKEAHELSIELKNNEQLTNNVFLLSISEKCKHLSSYTMKALYEETNKLYDEICTKLDDSQKDKFNKLMSEETVSLVDKVISLSINKSNKKLLSLINESYSINEDIDVTGSKAFDEKIIKLAVSKFNDKYDCLNEVEKKIIKGLALNEEDKLIDIFEDTKTTLTKKIKRKLLSSEDDLLTEKLKLTIDKVKTMQYCKDSFLEDFYKLENLEKSLN